MKRSLSKHEISAINSFYNFEDIRFDKKFADVYHSFLPHDTIHALVSNSSSDFFTICKISIEDNNPIIGFASGIHDPIFDDDKVLREFRCEESLDRLLKHSLGRLYKKHEYRCKQIDKHFVYSSLNLWVKNMCLFNEDLQESLLRSKLLIDNITYLISGK